MQPERLRNERVDVVGSGASAVHFALSLLRKGYRVRMLDVGYARPEWVRPEDTFQQLKANLPDPSDYFLGSQYESLVLPGHDGEYYGFPPNKNYIFASAAPFTMRASGFSPLISFAQGGLAEAWTGGCYPFHDDDLRSFPFGYRELEPWYAEVARRIGIGGAADDMSRFFPLHGGLSAPLHLDPHGALLLESYAKHKSYLNRELACYMGRARNAVLSGDAGGRKACSYCGRCLWGCPSGAFYTPSLTLEECRRHSNFEYVSGYYVTHFRTSGTRVAKLYATALHNGSTQEFEVSTLVLAAGALSSAKIFLCSTREDGTPGLELRGLMDNRQIMMPFLNLRMIGRPYQPDSYQYHQLAIGMAGAKPEDYIHGLVTTLKTALIHPIVPRLPVHLGMAVCLFRNMHAGLGLININFADHRRPENLVALEPAANHGGRLIVQYRPEGEERERIRQGTRRFRKLLSKLGCFAPESMTFTRPMGASVHYAGVLPMTDESRPLTVTKYCQSRDFPNLYLIDGATFPELPAKNLTFTLMANAVRVAEEAF